MLKIYVMLCSFIDGVLKNWSNQQKIYPKRKIFFGQSKLIIQIYSMSMMDMVKICWYLLDFLFPLLSASEISKCDPISQRKKPPRQLQYKWNTGMVQISSRNMDYSRTCLNKCNMFAANPTFARIGSRISFDMLKSLRRASVFYFPKPKTLNP